MSVRHRDLHEKYFFFPLKTRSCTFRLHTSHFLLGFMNFVNNSTAMHGDDWFTAKWGELKNVESSFFHSFYLKETAEGIKFPQFQANLKQEVEVVNPWPADRAQKRSNKTDCLHRAASSNRHGIFSTNSWSVLWVKSLNLLRKRIKSFTKKVENNLEQREQNYLGILPSPSGSIQVLKQFSWMLIAFFF